MSLSVDDVPPVAKGSGESATEVFIAWERLRLVYNGVLAAFALLIWARWPLRAGIGGLIEDAIVANVLFCAGMAAEGYLALIGMPRRPARIAIFGLGTLLAVLLAGVVLLLPDLAKF